MYKIFERIPCPLVMHNSRSAIALVIFGNNFLRVEVLQAIVFRCNEIESIDNLEC